MFFLRPCLRLPSIPPGQHNADIAGHAAREIDDLIFDAIAARLQVIGPELENLQRNAPKRPLPARLLLVDGAAVVGADRIREAVDLHLAETIPHRALDDGGSTLHLP